MNHLSSRRRATARAIAGTTAFFGIVSFGAYQSGLVTLPHLSHLPRIENDVAMASAAPAQGYKFPGSAPAPAPESQSEDVKALKSFSKVFVNLAKQTRPALVYIETKSKVERAAARSPFPFGMEEDFFGPFGPFQPFGARPRGGGGEQRGAGSGFIVDLGKGYVITNHHVAGNANDVSVTTFDNRKFKAKLVGSDPSTDIAVLKLENFSAGTLRQVSLADSDSVEVGDWVVALGAPFSLPQTLTTGVVSALGRGHIMGGQAIEDFIQTDAAINPGNSGGPLLNLEGRVIGMNTAISSPTGSSAGIGFAVPSNMIRNASEMLINEGKITRGYLGLQGQDFDELSPEALANLGLPEDAKGALVASVVKDSPAEKAGLKPYDIIENINGNPVTSFSQLRSRVAFLKPGTKVTLGVREGRDVRKVDVTIGAYPNEKATAQNSQGSQGNDRSGNAPESRQFGVAVAPLDADLRKQLSARAENGVVITEVAEGSAAQSVGFQRGDIIVEVNRKPVKSAGDVEKALAAVNKNSRSALFLVERQGRQTLLVIGNG